MYQKYFGLNQTPFSITPDPAFLYLSQYHREALAHLQYVAENNGFVLLSGEIGSGKTTLIRQFLQQLPRNVDTAVILNPRLSATELIGEILRDLCRIDPKGMTHPQVLKHLNDQLFLAHSQGRRVVLIVDEAQDLDIDLLEQLRLLTNLETAQHKLLQIILVGQPELRSVVQRPELEQLLQRITADFHLQTLPNDEIGPYIDHRLTVAGAQRQLFTKRAITAVGKASRGVPRLINALCDRALLGAYSEQSGVVDHHIIKRASRELLSLATPNSEGWLARSIIYLSTSTAVFGTIAAGWLLWQLNDSQPRPRIQTLSPVQSPVLSPAQIQTSKTQHPTPKHSINTTANSINKSSSKARLANNDDETRHVNRTYPTRHAKNQDLVASSKSASSARLVSTQQTQTQPSMPKLALVESRNKKTDTRKTASLLALNSTGIAASTSNPSQPESQTPPNTHTATHTATRTATLKKPASDTTLISPSKLPDHLPTEPFRPPPPDGTTLLPQESPSETASANIPASLSRINNHSAASKTLKLAKPATKIPSSPPQASGLNVSTATATLGAGTNPNPEQIAIQNLFQAWDLDYTKLHGWPCQRANSQGLRCIRSVAGIAGLEKFNRPALLQLSINGSQTTQPVIIVEYSDKKGALLLTAHGKQRLSNKQLKAQWSGDFLALWRPPKDYWRATRKPNEKASWVPKLRQQLAQLGFKTRAEARRTAYDKTLIRTVKRFQKSQGLNPDGLAGKLTLMRINTLLGKAPLIQTSNLSAPSPVSRRSLVGPQ